MNIIYSKTVIKQILQLIVICVFFIIDLVHSGTEKTGHNLFQYFCSPANIRYFGWGGSYNFMRTSGKIYWTGHDRDKNMLLTIPVQYGHEHDLNYQINLSCMCIVKWKYTGEILTFVFYFSLQRLLLQWTTFFLPAVTPVSV